MTGRPGRNGGDLFIVDNGDSDWKVRQYLHDWADIASKIDIATGYFEIGALLALDGQWQKLDELRVLMGDEVSRRTKQAMLAGVGAALRQLDASIEEEKKTNDFLNGIDGIVEGLSGPSPKIRCRVYSKEKFHAKAYINHARSAVIGSAALVGSSNFTYPGLHDNVELNVQIKGREVELLQEWYEHYWDKAQDITADVLRVVERHTREYSPFEVYAKALHEYFRGRALDTNAWETTADERGSRLYGKLSGYQQDGYHNLLKIADQFGGAFLCDGVGLGKTFVGLMLLERLIIHERKNVLLLVPKAGIESVWKPAIKKYVPHLTSGAFANLAILSHTDLALEKRREDVQAVKDRAHAIIIDEAHHFRNPGTVGSDSAQLGAPDPLAPNSGRIAGSSDAAPSRYRVLFDIAENKRLFLLTATPVNNKLADLRHMIELFSRRREDHFRETLGVNSLRAHFNQLEKRLEKTLGLRSDAGDAPTNAEQAKEVLAHDTLFKRLVVQRSRSYVRRSEQIAGAPATQFPRRDPPKVVPYSVKKTYGRLLGLVDAAFSKVEKPLFTLAVYYPLAYYRGPDKQIDKFAENRQKQVVALIRTGFLKRFESSVIAFERSCERLLVRLIAWIQVHAEGAQARALETWKRRESDVIGYVAEHQHELWGGEEDDAAEDLVDEELLESIERKRLARVDYDVESMITETMQDLDTLVGFMHELRKFKPADDGKVAALKKLLTADPVLKDHKVIIFTEFADTARYLKQQLEQSGIDHLAVVDGSTDGKARAGIIRRFAPYYNGTTTAALAKTGHDEIRVLISTDVLSEGLNLQDATRLINFDLHWNPVRLMQRIGRIDRRMNEETEREIVRDHPNRAPLRGHVAYFNFLPPDELNILLTLYSKVTHKTLRISKTMGIEGKKLLKEDDDYEDLKEFNEAYDGQKTQSPVETLRLEYEQLLADDPDLAARLAALPGRVFSGMDHPAAGSKGLFLCYALPGKVIAGPSSVLPGLWSAATPAAPSATAPESEQWSLEAGEVRWYFTAGPDGPIAEEPVQIAPLIRATAATARHCEMPRDGLALIRKAVEKHITNTYFKQRQAPIGVKPVLKCWMEVC